MRSERSIPLFPWIATAVLFHLITYDGADRVIVLLERKLELLRFAASVREQFAFSARPVEVSLMEEPSQVLPKPPPEVSEPEVQVRRPSQPKPPPPATSPRTTRQEPPKAPELTLKPAEPRKKGRKPPEAPKPSDRLPPDDRRIAVRQHVDDENQPDNPSAAFMGDHANRVKEQTQARITSTTQNDPSPTPGANQAGPSEEVGNAEKTRVAQADDHPGELNRAPQPEATVDSKPAAVRARETAANQAAARRQDPQLDEPALPSLPGVEGQSATLSGADGAWQSAEGRQAQTAQKGREARIRRRRATPGEPLLGFGSQALTDNGINLNLTPSAAMDAVGRDRLQRERRADAERRRSTHRGAWKSVGLQRWRSAIENYVPMVKPGNQTALNTARVPFAGYLNQVHNRIHPVFADTFLVSLDRLPRSHAMNRMDISTALELVLDREEGRLVRMGVTKTSGVTAFDVGALESVSRAAPFGPPPSAILSPDGKVYLHWEFHRYPWYACSTYFARPYILRAAPQSVPSKLDPPTKQERPGTEGG
ncbi:hypothetical protein ACFL5O_03675 [Myxococcota bacterium]